MKHMDFFAGRADRFHLVGIGGSGMSAIAEILTRSGHTVSGSDAAQSDTLDRLKRQGVAVYLGHGAKNLADSRIVVYSSAIRSDNPELIEARRRGLPLVHRSEILAEMARFRFGIAVSGTHGKTTTTAMTARLLEEAGKDPSAVVGARVTEWGSNARLGTGSHFVFEADESDGSFLRSPSLCNVVTNIDCDHMDHYRDQQDLLKAFTAFMNRVPFYGWVVACLDDPLLRACLKNVHRRVITYGFGEEAVVRTQNVELRPFQSSYECYFDSRLLGRVQLHLAGRHNVLNSMAAIAVGLDLGIPFSTIAGALESFRGTERRLQWKGEREGVWVVDDYAHHPTEIAATLEACRLTGRRIIAVYQPHRFSRTAYLMERMTECFQGADHLYLLDIYAAGEEPLPGVTAEILARSIGRQRQVVYVSAKEIQDRLRQETRPGDLVLTMGAGDVWKIGEKFLEQET